MKETILKDKQNNNKGMKDIISPKISIIVPVYNVERFIGRCIESVINQTLSDWELILVDDCGNDDSMRVVETYSNKDERIRIIRSKHNVGPMIAREKGYTYSKGDYITFLDGDDTLPKNALEILYNSIIETKSDVVIGNHQQIIEGGTSKNKCYVGKYGEYSKVFIYKQLLDGSVSHVLWAKLFNAGLFRNYDYEIFEGLKNGEDGLLLYQVLSNTSKILIIPDFVYEYWIYNTSSSHKKMNDDIVRSLAFFDYKRKEILLKELGDVSSLFYKNTYVPLVYLSKKYPYKRLLKIYREYNVFDELSECEVLRLFTLKNMIKYYLFTRYYMLKVQN